jgi:phosphatidylserine/phosphatidylglycerophosphate/cardiolipin synthase-like enzyme
VAQALVQAKANKIDVQVILDQSNVEGQYSKLSLLLAGKVTTLIDAKHAIAHDKVIIVDGRHVETGSFNYTAAAQKRNGENCVFVWDNAELATSYTNNWEAHKAHATLAKR